MVRKKKEYGLGVMTFAVGEKGRMLVTKEFKTTTKKD